MTTYHHFVAKFRMGGATLLLSLYGFRLWIDTSTLLLSSSLQFSV